MSNHRTRRIRVERFGRESLLRLLGPLAEKYEDESIFVLREAVLVWHREGLISEEMLGKESETRKHASER